MAAVAYLGSPTSPDLHGATRLIAVVFSQTTFTTFTFVRPFVPLPYPTTIRDGSRLTPNPDGTLLLSEVRGRSTQTPPMAVTD